MIFLEVLHDGSVHVTKLRTMAFVEDNDYVLLVHPMCLVLFDEDGKLLDGGDNDAGVVVLKLFLQYCRRRIGIGCPLFEAVIFLHGLIVQVLAVHHKEDFVNVGQRTGKSRGFERC